MCYEILSIKNLFTVKIDSRHVMLITDGQDGTDSFEVAQKIARSGVTISTIAIGLDADKDLLDRIAQIGNGIFYNLKDVIDLPRVFVE